MRESRSKSGFTATLTAGNPVVILDGLPQGEYDLEIICSFKTTVKTENLRLLVGAKQKGTDAVDSGRLVGTFCGAQAAHFHVHVASGEAIAVVVDKDDSTGGGPEIHGSITATERCE